MPNFQNFTIFNTKYIWFRRKVCQNLLARPRSSHCNSFGDQVPVNLIYCCLVMKCVGKLTIIGSDNGLSPGRRQAIIWTNAWILLIWPLGTNFNEILIGNQTFSFKKMHLKMSSAKWRPFCLSLNVLNDWISVASVTKVVNQWLAKLPLVFNGRFAKSGLLNIEAIAKHWPQLTSIVKKGQMIVSPKMANSQRTPLLTVRTMFLYMYWSDVTLRNLTSMITLWLQSTPVGPIHIRSIVSLLLVTVDIFRAVKCKCNWLSLWATFT